MEASDRPETVPRPDDPQSSALPSVDLTARIVAIQRPLFGYVLTFLPDAAQAEDVLQNANQRMLGERARWHEVREFEAWARELARFEVLAFVKRKTRDRLRLIPGGEMTELAVEVFERLDGSDDELAALGHCEQKLPAPDRELIEQRYRDGLSVGDIASRAGRTPGAIRQAMYRIRRALLACIERRLAVEGGGA